MAAKQQNTQDGEDLVTLHHPDGGDGQFSTGEFVADVRGGTVRVPAEFVDAAFMAGFRPADDGAAEAIDDGIERPSALMTGDLPAITAHIIEE